MVGTDSGNLWVSGCQLSLGHLCHTHKGENVTVPTALAFDSFDKAKNYSDIDGSVHPAEYDKAIPLEHVTASMNRVDFQLFEDWVLHEKALPFSCTLFPAPTGTLFCTNLRLI